MGATALSTFASGEAHRYKFTVTFPDGGTPAGPLTGDNAYKGDDVTVDYNWESVSNSSWGRQSRPCAHEPAAWPIWPAAGSSRCSWRSRSRRWR
jgi:hypothetical protein